MSLNLSELEAKSRSGAGKGFARRTRAAGLVPAIVYGKGLEKPIPVAVNAKAVHLAISTPKKLNTLVGLKIDGQPPRMVMLKDYQRDPVSHDLLHVDFMDVRENEQVKVRVPVALTGKAEGVVLGGILSQMLREIEIWALPAAIPERLEIDVTSMKIGGSIHANDLKLPAGVTVKTNVNYTVAVVTAPEEEKVAEVVAEVAVAGAPGAAPGAAAGAAPGAAPGAAGAPAAAAAGDKKAEGGKPAKK